MRGILGEQGFQAIDGVVAICGERVAGVEGLGADQSVA
jgi:hypothetical protein